MSLAIRSTMLVLGMCCGALITAVEGQQRKDLPRPEALLSHTVSVSTLQVPAKAWKHFEKARNAAEHNRTGESEQESTKALEIAPNFGKAYILRATQEIHEQRFEEAIADATAAARVEPGILWSSVILAGAYNSTRHYKKALMVLDNLRGPEADTWQAKFEHARAEIGSGNVEAALYWSALALQSVPPTNSDVYLVRTDAFLLAHNWRDAVSEMKIYLESKNPQTHRGEVLVLLQQIEKRIDAEKSPEMASR